jgi:site-specific DNA recombinase
MRHSIAKKRGSRQGALVVTAPRVALYCRVSTDEQAAKDTIQAQLTYLRGRAALDEIPIVGEYLDEGVSGTVPLEERPEGHRLLADAQADIFDAVWVYRVDRLARSLRVLLDGYTALEAAGVVLKSATEPFDTATPMGKFLFQLLGSMAELERSTIIERMNLGRDRITRLGRWLNGPIPYGYQLDAVGCLCPSERLVEVLGITEAALVRDLFLRVQDGSSATQEALRLTALGVPTVNIYANGRSNPGAQGTWRPARVLSILKSHTYKGTHTFKSRFGPIVREVPPLVSLALWEAVQLRLQQNRSLPKPNRVETYLLRGLVECGACGCNYVGQRIPRTSGKVDRYYRCNARNPSVRPDPKTRCQNPSIQATWLEDRLWQRVLGYIEHPEEALEEARQQLTTRMAHTERTAENEQHLLHQLAEKHQEHERARLLFRRGRVSLEETEQDLARIDQERAGLQVELNRIRDKATVTLELEERYHRVTGRLERLQERLPELRTTTDVALKQATVQDLLQQVVARTDGYLLCRWYFGEERVADPVTHLTTDNCNTLFETLLARDVAD